MTDNTNEAESWNDLYYDFKINTPWKFGVSLGHTVGNFLALGATYEYSDYSTIDNRIKDDGYWYDDWYGDYYYDASSSDDVMNRHTENSLKGVHTLKLGLEVKPMPQFAIRAVTTSSRRYSIRTLSVMVHCLHQAWPMPLPRTIPTGSPPIVSRLERDM